MNVIEVVSPSLIVSHVTCTGTQHWSDKIWLNNLTRRTKHSRKFARICEGGISSPHFHSAIKLTSDARVLNSNYADLLHIGQPFKDN